MEATKKERTPCTRCGDTGLIEVVVAVDEYGIQELDYQECPVCYGGWR